MQTPRQRSGSFFSLRQNFGRVLTQSLKRDRSRTEKMLTVTMAAIATVATVCGVLRYENQPIIERLKNDPVVLAAALAFAAYEAISKVVEATKTDDDLNAAAFDWVTYPLKVAFAVAATGYLIGTDGARVLEGKTPWPSISVVAFALGLLIAVVARSAYTYESPEQQARRAMRRRKQRRASGIRS